MELELEDPKYDGQKVSRDKILNGASSDDVDLDPFDQGDEESEEMGSFSDEGSVDEEGSATFSQTGSDQDEDSDAQGNSNDEEEDEQSANGDTLDPSSVQAELQELQKEEKNMMHSLSSMSKGDIAKGQAVQSQMVRQRFHFL